MRARSAHGVLTRGTQVGVARGRENGAVPIEMEPERFDALVDRALDGIPDELASLVRNVVVLVEDEPPEGEPDDLLGLYDGVALTERDGTLSMQLPDRIFVFRGPLLDFCENEEELVEEVRITVVHEIAHHFGIDDRRLHELGYA
jgi:predicted Zn-dependent protease with MMP-like domain